MTRKFATFLNSIFWLALVCTILFYLLFTTPIGLNQTFRLVQQFLPGKLTIQQLEGSLAGPITFTEIAYQDAGIELTIHKLKLDWTLKHLLQQQLLIKYLIVEQPKILIKPSDTTTQTDWQALLKYIRVDKVSVQQGLLQYRDNLLKIQGSLEQEWHINWQLIIPNFKSFSKDLQGKLDLQGKISGPHNTPKLLVPFNNEKFIGKGWAIRHLQGLLTLSFNPIKLTAQLNDLKLDLPNFKNLTGQFNANIRIDEMLNHPQFYGEVALNNAYGQLPALALSLRKINIHAAFDNTHVQWLGSLKSGAGNLALTGTTHLKEKNLTTDLNLRGKNLTISDLKNYKVIATPNLQINIDTKHITINGEVFLPKARIDLGEDENSIVTLSNDVIFTDQKSTASTVLPISSKISLRLGSEIKLHYQGLRSFLNGHLIIIEEPDRPTRANGQLNLYQGRYKYYNNTLNLQDDSHILFQGGPIDNPVLHITASKTVTFIPQTANIASSLNTNTSASPSFFAALTQPLQSLKMLVGVHVQGNAQNPQLKLFSDPAVLSQADILSFLITGQPSSQLSTASAQLLFNAVNSLNGGSKNLKNIVKSIQQGIGLDQLSVQDTSYVNPTTNTYTSNTSLVLGKALSPRLYINYSIGLLEPVNVLQINYFLTKFLSLQSANSTLTNSIDLLFKIEKE